MAYFSHSRVESLLSFSPHKHSIFSHTQVLPKCTDEKTTTSAWYNISNRIGLDLQSQECDSFGSRASLLENIVNNALTHSTHFTASSPRTSTQTLSTQSPSTERHEQVIKKKDTKPSSSTTRTVRRRHTPIKFNNRKAVQSVQEIQTSLRRSPRRSTENSISEGTGLSKESWIPMKVRMKMLRRNMGVVKINTESRRQYDDVYGDLDRHDTVVEELERSKRSDFLTRRTRKKLACALCEMEFTAKNLCNSVSYKAIMDIRLSWGVEIPPDPRYNRFPHWYKPVQVCVFCSQFFQKEGGLFDSPERGVLKSEMFSDNDKQTLVDMGLRSRSPKRNTVLSWKKRGSSSRKIYRKKSSDV